MKRRIRQNYWIRRKKYCYYLGWMPICSCKIISILPFLYFDDCYVERVDWWDWGCHQNFIQLLLFFFLNKLFYENCNRTVCVRFSRKTSVIILFWGFFAGEGTPPSATAQENSFRSFLWFVAVVWITGPGLDEHVNITSVMVNNITLLKIWQSCR